MLLISCLQVKAQSVELFAGNKNTQGDIQWLKPFSEKSRFLFFNRNRFTVDYNNNTTYFISGITAFQFKNGFGVANEMLITENGWLPKIGIQYLKNNDKMTFYFWANTSYLEEFKYHVFSFIRYQPRINETMKWYFQLEIVTNFNRIGNEFSAQRPRVGISFNHIQLGLASDITQVGKDWKTETNTGLFIRKEF